MNEYLCTALVFAVTTVAEPALARADMHLPNWLVELGDFWRTKSESASSAPDTSSSSWVTVDNSTIRVGEATWLVDASDNASWKQNDRQAWRSVKLGDDQVWEFVSVAEHRRQIERVWVVDRLEDTSHSLVVSTSLSNRLANESNDDLKLGDPTFVDRNGRQFPVKTQLQGGKLVYTVEASTLKRAEYPAAVVTNLTPPDIIDPDDYDQDGVPESADCDDFDPNVGRSVNHYYDTDGDGYGDHGSSPRRYCPGRAPSGWVRSYNDQCQHDPQKRSPGLCGCGIEERTSTYYPDTDGDGVGAGSGTTYCDGRQPSGYVTRSGDQCPDHRHKTSPGVCGCPLPDSDNDGDGRVFCEDCDDDDAEYQDYRTYYADWDGDGYGFSGGPIDHGGSLYATVCRPPAGYVLQTGDYCDNDPLKTLPGVCGCKVPDDDPDGDLVAECVDNCPGVSNSEQEDVDGDGTGAACDCEDTEPYCQTNCTPDRACELYRCDGDGDGLCFEDDCNDDAFYCTDNCDVDLADVEVPDGVIKNVPLCARCDTDGDGLCFDDDCEPYEYNNLNKPDDDCDGHDDDCDGQFDEDRGDADNDGWMDCTEDNCPDVWNPDQANINADLEINDRGDACDDTNFEVKAVCGERNPLPTELTKLNVLLWRRQRQVNVGCLVGENATVAEYTSALRDQEADTQTLIDRIGDVDPFSASGEQSLIVRQNERHRVIKELLAEVYEPTHAELALDVSDLEKADSLIEAYGTDLASHEKQLADAMLGFAALRERCDEVHQQLAAIAAEASTSSDASRLVGLVQELTEIAQGFAVASDEIEARAGIWSENVKELDADLLNEMLPVAESLNSAGIDPPTTARGQDWAVAVQRAAVALKTQVSDRATYYRHNVEARNKALAYQLADQSVAADIAFTERSQAFEQRLNDLQPNEMLHRPSSELLALPLIYEDYRRAQSLRQLAKICNANSRRWMQLGCEGIFAAIADVDSFLEAELPGHLLSADATLAGHGVPPNVIDEISMRYVHNRLGEAALMFDHAVRYAESLAATEVAP